MEISTTAVVHDRKAPLASCEVRARRAFERGLISLNAYQRLIGIAVEANGEGGGISVAAGGDSARGDDETHDLELMLAKHSRDLDQDADLSQLRRMRERGFGLSSRARRFRSEGEGDAEEGAAKGSADEEKSVDERLLEFMDVCLKIYPPRVAHAGEAHYGSTGEAVPSVPHDDIFLVGDEAASSNSTAQLQPQTMGGLRRRGIAANASSMAVSSEKSKPKYDSFGTPSEAKNNSFGINSDIKSIVNERGREGVATDPLPYLIASHKWNEAQADDEASAVSQMPINETPLDSRAPTDEEVMRALGDQRFGDVTGTGHWTREEHDRFLSAILRHGRNWGAITACVETRTLKQVKLHAQKYTEMMKEWQRKRPGSSKKPQPKNAKTGRWTKEEYRLFNAKTGRWTKEEHQRFVNSHRRHGRNWEKVTADVKTRTQLQVRTHAQKFLSPTTKDGLRKGRWTKQECQLFVDAYRRHGNDWRKVAADVKTRTKVQVWTHAQKYLSSLKKNAAMNENNN